MKHLLPVLIVSSLFLFPACKQSKSQDKISLSARQWNDSAVWIAAFSDRGHQKAIELLNRAIQIDSTYYLAYWNKFVYTAELKKYDSMALVADQLDGLRPGSAQLQTGLGLAYLHAGDSTTANKYFSKAILLYDQKLDSPSPEKKLNDITHVEKAIVLILMGQEIMGQEILKTLSVSLDEDVKSYIDMFINKSREEVLKEQITRTGL